MSIYKYSRLHACLVARDSTPSEALHRLLPDISEDSVSVNPTYEDVFLALQYVQHDEIGRYDVI